MLLLLARILYLEPKECHRNVANDIAVAKAVAEAVVEAVQAVEVLG
jgi:hypothetical protein